MNAMLIVFQRPGEDTQRRCSVDTSRVDEEVRQLEKQGFRVLAVLNWKQAVDKGLVTDADAPVSAATTAGTVEIVSKPLGIGPPPEVRDEFAEFASQHWKYVAEYVGVLFAAGALLVSKASLRDFSSWLSLSALMLWATIPCWTRPLSRPGLEPKQRFSVIAVTFISGLIWWLWLYEALAYGWDDSSPKISLVCSISLSLWAAYIAIGWKRVGGPTTP